MNNIARAAYFARHCHEGQKRKYSNEHYIVHPFRVAGWTAALIPENEAAICAAYLHDVVEGCGITGDMLVDHFGESVTGIVLELTNPSKERHELSRKQRKTMDREHLASVSSEAKLIKLIDRWDNLKDVPLYDPEAKRFLRQTYLNESHQMCQILIQDALVLQHVRTIALPQLIASMAELLDVKLKDSSDITAGSHSGSRSSTGG